MRGKRNDRSTVRSDGRGGATPWHCTVQESAGHRTAQAPGALARVGLRDLRNLRRMVWAILKNKNVDALPAGVKVALLETAYALAREMLDRGQGRPPTAGSA